MSMRKSIISLFVVCFASLALSIGAQAQTEPRGDWLTPAQIDILNSDECAANPEFAGCQEEFYLPDCVNYPNIAACSDDDIDHGNVPPPTNPSEDSFDLTDPMLEPIQDEDEDFADPEAFVEELAGEDEEDDKSFVDEEDADPFDNVAFEEMLEEADRELQAERDCANVARLTAMNERLRFEFARADERLLEAERTLAFRQSQFELAQNHYASIAKEGARIRQRIAELREHNQPVPENLLISAGTNYQLGTSAEDELTDARGAVQSANGLIYDIRAQNVELAHRQNRNEDEIAAYQSNCD